MKKYYAWGLGVVVSLSVGAAVLMRGSVARQLPDLTDSSPSASNAIGNSTAGAVAAFKGGGGGRTSVDWAMAKAPATAPGLAASPDAEQGAKLTLASMSDSQADRYLIKNAVTVIEAKDVLDAAKQAKEAAKAVNGYVSNSHESVDNLGLRNVTLELRVPSSQFDASMNRLEAIGRVLDNQVTSEDVTEQYVDTDAQLRNLKQTEARLLDHLQKTGKLSDTLLVETELTRVRESANELEGKLRFMSHRVTFSTIGLTFKEPGHIEPIAPAESFSLGQVTSQAMRSFTGFLQSVISVGIWALIWSVLWAPILVGSRFAWVRYRTGAIRR